MLPPTLILYLQPYHAVRTCWPISAWPPPLSEQAPRPPEQPQLAASPLLMAASSMGSSPAVSSGLGWLG